jgi:hypothetical protein
MIEASPDWAASRAGASDMSPKDGARSLARRALRAIRGGGGPVAASSAKEPCLACGEETAVGSVFFSDRLAVPRDGATAFLCSLCSARVRSSRPDRRMSEEEVRRSVENGTAAALAWGNAPGPML